jgi:hypothetical protein
MATTNLQALVRSSSAVRRELEGPGLAEQVRGVGPKGGWEAIRDTSVENQLTGGWDVSRANMCGGCFQVKSVTGECGGC